MVLRACTYKSAHAITRPLKFAAVVWEAGRWHDRRDGEGILFNAGPMGHSVANPQWSAHSYSDLYLSLSLYIYIYMYNYVYVLYTYIMIARVRGGSTSRRPRPERGRDLVRSGFTRERGSAPKRGGHSTIWFSAKRICAVAAWWFDSPHQKVVPRSRIPRSTSHLS